MIYEINTPKPPDDIWAIEVDFTDRLNTDGGEELSGVSIQAYRLWGYDQVLEEIPVSGGVRFNVEVEKEGGETDRYSWLLPDIGSVELRIPSSYSPQLDYTVVDLASVTIGPSSGSPPNTKVSFNIQHGEDGYRYALLITATTNQGRQHSCVIRFRVQELNLTG